MKIRYHCTACKIEFNVYDRDFDLSKFPKSYKVYQYRLTFGRRQGTWIRPYTISAVLEADNVNKGKNEAGLKRLEKFLKLCKKLYGNVKLIERGHFQTSIDLPQSLLDAIK